MGSQAALLLEALNKAADVMREAKELNECFKERDSLCSDLEDARVSLNTAITKLKGCGFYDWRLVYHDGQGHRLFYDAMTGRYSIADQSGDSGGYSGVPFRYGTPDQTDDGVLWLDPNRPCIIRAHARPDRLNRDRDGEKEPMTWERTHPGVDVPVIDKEGQERHCGVILEFFLDGMLKEAKMRPEIEIAQSCRHIYDIMTFVREEKLVRVVR